MSTAIVKHDGIPSAIEEVLVGGNLAQLQPEQRVAYYKMVCDSVGLNPLTRPFEYIVLNGKLTLYARKDATDQLRNINQVSVEIVGREVVEDCYVVTSAATLPSGRRDSSIGAVSISGLKGEAKCNAMMKAETKSKRRVTLSICGLGILDETEVETIPSAKPAPEYQQVAKEPVTFRKKEPQPETQVSPAATVAEAPLPPADHDGIDKGQAANLHRAFRSALDPEKRKLADDLLREWLRHEGILNILGEPSTLAIRRESFEAVREACCEYARSL